MLSLCIAALVFCIAVYGLPESQSALKAYALKSSHMPAQQWTKTNAVSPNHVINLQIGLKQGKFDEVLRRLAEVSDPDHANYGRYLSAQELNKLTQPKEETTSLVTEWLSENGINPSQIRYSAARDWMYLDVPVQKANQLLAGEYSMYENHAGKAMIRTPDWSLPRYLHDHIDTIQPTNSFFNPSSNGLKPEAEPLNSVSIVTRPAQGPRDPVAAVCTMNRLTPYCLRALYGTQNYTARAAGRNKMAMTNYLDELSLAVDARQYLSKYRPDIIAVIKPSAKLFDLVSINNGTIQQTPFNPAQQAANTGIEGGLDVQTMLGIAWPTPLTIYSTGGRQPDFIPDDFTPTNTNEPYLDWVNYMLALDDDVLPQVVSTSYADTEQSVAKDYAIRVCNQFAALGARGVSMVFGSGDEGVGGKGCLRNDGSGKSTFIPEFPPSCPYITVIGGTQDFNPEVAADDPNTGFTSGGGFGEYFARPSYQDAAVTQYLDINNNFSDKYSGIFNTAGRAYPDMAAQSVNYGIVWNGTLRNLDGTSASTPAVAAILAMVNDALISSGKPTLGFLNPWLYKKGYTAFNDILSGGSAGCNTPGFPASKGWDAVTGFGSPNFPKILRNFGVDDKLDR
ncbi:subtilisin-like protein [Tothia fuscella]|uniref:tripeptidyl-peptidase II n=1 Tax=Tothia fuscella TaxID=1048955 RepID=A0A9P4TYM9_9PEZI|nr:subtilisin-like protein [Tothia fuscella]